MRRSRTILATALVLTGLLPLAACTGSNGGSSASAPELAPQRPSAAAGGSANGGAGSAVGRSDTSFGASSATAKDLTDVKAVAPSLIITGSLSVAVPRGTTVDAVADKAERIADAAGGRVDSDNRTEPVGRSVVPSAVLTLRVPNSDVPGVLDRLAALGKATDRRLHTRDVTTQVVDVASRVASARAAIASLDKLYKQATRVRDVISIETTLSQREADLEALEAQLDALQGQVALATITLTLQGHRARAVAVPHRSSGPGGVLGGLEDGWHAFATSVVGIVTGLAAALPFLAVLTALGAVGAFTWRRSRRARSVSAPKPEA